MALLAAQSPRINGTNPTYTQVNSTDTVRFTNAPSVLIVKNGGGGSINVTVVVPGKRFEQDNPDVVVAVPAAGERWIGPLDSAMAVDGIITVNYSGTTTVTAALMSL
jgi:hypothetical protein